MAGRTGAEGASGDDLEGGVSVSGGDVGPEGAWQQLYEDDPDFAQVGV